MAFREPTRSPLGAFHRSPLKARLRVSAAPQLQFVDGRGHTFFLDSSNTTRKECGPDDRDWSIDAVFVPPGDDNAFYCRFASQPSQVAAVQYETGDGLTYELHKCEFVVPATPWDRAGAPGSGCFGKSDPSSDLPAHAGTRTAWQIRFDTSLSIPPPDVFRVTPSDASAKQFPGDSYNSPITWVSGWLVAELPATDVTLISYDVTISRASWNDVTDRLPVAFEPNSTAPGITIISEPPGGVVSFGYLVQDWRAAPVLQVFADSMDLGLNTVVLEGHNAWQTVKSQATINITITP